MRKQNLVRRRASSGEDPNNGYLNTAYCTSGCWFNWLRFHSCRVDNRILQYGYKSSLIPEWSSRFMRGKSRNHCLTGKTKGGKRLLNPLTLKPRERKWAKPVGCKLIRPIGNQKARLRDRRPGLSPFRKGFTLKEDIDYTETFSPLSIPSRRKLYRRVAYTS